MKEDQVGEQDGGAIGDANGDGNAANPMDPVMRRPARSVPTKTHVDVFRSSGNAFFVEEKFEEAVGMYDKAIKRNEEANNAAADSLHLIYSNRSAAHLKLGNIERAIEDAKMAVSLNPDWIKAYHRLGSAYLARQGQWWKARQAYEEARKTEEGRTNEWLHREIEKVNAMVQEEDTKAEIQSKEHWIEVFRHITDLRRRLATLAEFWNLSSKSERFTIFRRFLVLLHGKEKAKEVEKEHKEEDMEGLPMENYADLKLHENWKNYHTSLTVDQKLETFEEMFAQVSDQERTLIISDLLHFFSSKAKDT